MKRIIVLLLSMLSLPLIARIGCRDNSYHMQERYDYKTDHAVECYCNCANTLGRCIKCGHYHEPQPWTIIQSHKTNKNKKAQNSYHPISVLKKVVAEYKSKQHKK